MVSVAEIVLVRHGQTEWSAASRHTSYTDLDLTPDGERQAVALRRELAGRPFAAVLSSPRKRALRTAYLAGTAVTAVDPDLAEWDYGEYEGRTTGDIRAERPEWTLWRDGCPGGESPADVAGRIDRLLDRVRPLVDGGGDVALIGHAHALRVAGARWVGCGPQAGRLLRLDTGTLSRLGFEHHRPVLLSWNAPVPSAAGAGGSRTAWRARP